MRVPRRAGALALGMSLVAGCAGGLPPGPVTPPDAAARPDGGGAPDAQGPPPVADAGALEFLGPEHTGEFHLGPVEWTGSFNNACSPYPGAVQTLEGGMLAGLSDAVAGTGDACDACIYVQTDRGREALLRVVTYGTTAAPGNIDVSQAAFTALNAGENPRAMRWRLVKCPVGEPVYLQFQTGANEWWTSFWVRNPRVAVDHVEVRSANHAAFFRLRRQTDGTLNDDGGFGAGAFTLRIVGVNGATLEQSFPGFTPGALVRGTANFP